MLRAILKTESKHAIGGTSAESFRTIEFDCPAIEAALRSGGMNETSYEITNLIGVEVIRRPNP